MRVAIQNPGFLFADQTRNFDGYNFAFLRKYKPALYLTGWKARVSRGLRWRQALVRAGLHPVDFELVYDVKGLSRVADVLLCFSQAACLPPNVPPRGFSGLKVWHVMDFNYRAADCHEALCRGGVDFLMAYARLDRDCAFFQRYYPAYLGKVIPVPFGFGERFQNRTPFSERTQKVVAMGAINPVDQGSDDPNSPLREYAEFYRTEGYSQLWRKRLAEHEESLRDVLVSFLPKPPAVSRPTDNPVDLLNSYSMYANDESICGFPPARTYEGAAAGAAMVSSNHPAFTDLGFVDGENCIMHRPLDLQHFRERVLYYLERPDALERVARNGTAMVREHYTHPAVAERLYATFLEMWNGGVGNPLARQGLLAQLSRSC
jgi:hypothetical protein